MSVTRKDVLSWLRHLGRLFPTHYHTAWQLTEQLPGADYAMVEQFCDAMVRIRKLESITRDNKRAYRVRPAGP